MVRVIKQREKGKRKKERGCFDGFELCGFLAMETKVNAKFGNSFFLFIFPFFFFFFPSLLALVLPDFKTGLFYIFLFLGGLICVSKTMPRHVTSHVPNRNKDKYFQKIKNVICLNFYTISFLFQTCILNICNSIHSK